MFTNNFRNWVLLVVLLSVTTVTVDGRGQPFPATATPGSHKNHINYYYARQIAEQWTTSSSSYDYWWPYPPAGDPTTPTTTLLATFTPTDTPLAATSAPVLAFSFESAVASSTSASSISVSSSALPAQSTSSSSSSESASESMVTISAMPPSNSNIPFSAPHKLSMVSSSNLVYIVSACGAVGLLIGGTTAWCVYGCLTRNGHGHGRGRRGGRKSYGTLEVGPEYTPPTPPLGQEKDSDVDENEEEGSDSEEGEWVGNQKLLEEQEGADTLLDEPRLDEETRAFLHPETAHKRAMTNATAPARNKSVVSSRAPSPTPSGRTSLFFDRPDITDTVPWESLRHKSIKRGMLERLRDDEEQGAGQRGGHEQSVARRPPWQAHGRHDSDLLVADAQADLTRESSARTAITTTTAREVLSRASSSVTAGIAMGFRIMSESPAGTPQRERGAEVFRWPSVSGDKDRYTYAPTRVARSRSRSPEKMARAGSAEGTSRAASPEKGQRMRGQNTRKRTGGMRPMSPVRARPVVRGRRAVPGPGAGNSNRNSERQGAPGADIDIRNVLPQSPPRISSPVLDEALCFTPIPEAYSYAEGVGAMGMASFASFGAPTASTTEPKQNGEVELETPRERPTGAKARSRARRPTGVRAEE